MGSIALLGKAHFNFSRTTAKIFHFGYLMLMSEMDRLVKNGRTIARRVIEAALSAGLVTNVVLVSSTVPKFRQITAAALPHTDVLIFTPDHAIERKRRAAALDGARD